jgi:hypothetical protein
VGYESKDTSGNIYLLEITKKASSRAAYTPSDGDTYILTVVTPSGDFKTSSGTIKVEKGNSNTFQLTPTGSLTTFTVTIEGENMTGMSGTINFIDGNTPISAPASITSVQVKGVTLKLKANRWGGTLDSNELGGESWVTDREFKLSEFTSVKPTKSGCVYRFRIRGTTNKPLKWMNFQINYTAPWREDRDYIYEWLAGPIEENLVLSESFDCVLSMWVRGEHKVNMSDGDFYF